MSGGSYGYLYRQDLQDSEWVYQFQGMLDDLLADPQTRNLTATQDMRAVRRLIHELRNNIVVLSDFMQAYEWYRSGDWGIEEVLEANAKYIR